MILKSIKLRNSIIFLFGLIMITNTLPAQPSADELQQVYLEMLEARGLTGFVDEDGDVQFEYMEKAYFIGVDPNDPEFLE